MARSHFLLGLCWTKLVSFLFVFVTCKADFFIFKVASPSKRDALPAGMFLKSAPSSPSVKGTSSSAGGSTTLARSSLAAEEEGNKHLLYLNLVMTVTSLFIVMLLDARGVKFDWDESGLFGLSSLPRCTQDPAPGSLVLVAWAASTYAGKDNNVHLSCSLNWVAVLNECNVVS
jgi:hypothetical protein